MGIKLKLKVRGFEVNLVCMNCLFAFTLIPAEALRDRRHIRKTKTCRRGRRPTELTWVVCSSSSRDIPPRSNFSRFQTEFTKFLILSTEVRRLLSSGVAWMIKPHSLARSWKSIILYNMRIIFST